MPAGRALRRIHLAQLDVIRANEAGTRQGSDPEALHDFRVAVRRTRAALTQIDDVYPADTVRRFKKLFSWLQKVTGPTRDLDVYREAVAGFRAELPAGREQDLEPLAAWVTAQRRRAHRRMVRSLDTPRYRRLLESWRAFVEEASPGGAGAPCAGEPIATVATRHLAPAYRKVLGRGLKIGPGSPAAALHRLRLDCKKLRYLLEFFRSLYPDRQIGPPIKELRRLQDCLGEFNDAAVQRAATHRFAEEMRGTGPVASGRRAPAAALEAMRIVEERLPHRQARQRARFERVFARFASAANQRRFERLLTRY